MAGGYLAPHLYSVPQRYRVQPPRYAPAPVQPPVTTYAPAPSFHPLPAPTTVRAAPRIFGGFADTWPPGLLVALLALGVAWYIERH